MTEALIERECSIQVRKWRESRGELTHQPVRRLHGTRDIHEHKRRASAISSGGSFSFLGSIPPPGPLRASSSLLSLPGFRKSKTPFHSQKKGSFSGASGMEAMQRQNPSAAASSPPGGPAHKPPMSSGSVARAPASQSPLVGSGPAQTSAQSQPGASASAPVHHTPPNTLSPKVTSEQITPTIPSPTANNTPLPPFPDGGGGGGAAATGGEDDRKKKRSKEDKKKEKEEEKRKEKEKKKDKADKESQKKEKERAEKEKKKEKGGKKKDRGGGEAEEKNGATAPRDSA